MHHFFFFWKNVNVSINSFWKIPKYFRGELMGKKMWTLLLTCWDLSHRHYSRNNKPRMRGHRWSLNRIGDSDPRITITYRIPRLGKSTTRLLVSTSRESISRLHKNRTKNLHLSTGHLFFRQTPIFSFWCFFVFFWWENKERWLFERVNEDKIKWWSWKLRERITNSNKKGISR